MLDHFRAERVQLQETGGQPLEATLLENSCGLSATVVQGHCMDISNLSYKGLSIPYLSPCGINAPAQWGFERCFAGGMLYTCGLSNVGDPTDDEPMHGRIHHSAAKYYGISVSDEAITLKGTMHEYALFGNQWQMDREIRFSRKSAKIRIHDAITNTGDQEQLMLLLYHINFSSPFLCEDTRIFFPEGTTTIPATKYARQHLDAISQINAPSDDVQEQDFYHTLPVENGYSCIRIENAAEKIGCAISYSADPLRYLVEWKNFRNSAYILGLEPANNPVENKTTAGSHPDAYRVKPGETKHSTVELAFYET